MVFLYLCHYCPTPLLLLALVPLFCCRICTFSYHICTQNQCTVLGFCFCYYSVYFNTSDRKRTFHLNPWIVCFLFLINSINCFMKHASMPMEDRKKDRKKKSMWVNERERQREDKRSIEAVWPREWPLAQHPIEPSCSVWHHDSELQFLWWRR